jgi:hypothetical protein
MDRLFAIGKEVWRGWGHQIGYICVTPQYDFFAASVLAYAVATFLLRRTKPEVTWPRLIRYSRLSIGLIGLVWSVALILPVTEFTYSANCVR